ncbi:cyclic nucleotide-binding domain-containing protein [Myxococcota bacterium]|nr:cyclic nucleotide-binding domain-containing protein [Myxococcota bacterium]
MNAAKDLLTTVLFSGLEDDAIAGFAGIATEMKYDPGQVVYATGSAGDSLYVVVEGTVVVRAKDENGEEVDIAEIKEGASFGEMEVLGGMNRTASIVADSDARCYRFDAITLIDFLKRNDKLAAHFYRATSLELIKRLKSTTRDMGYFKARSF